MNRTFLLAALGLTSLAHAQTVRVRRGEGTSAAPAVKTVSARKSFAVELSPARLVTGGARRRLKAPTAVLSLRSGKEAGLRTTLSPVLKAALPSSAYAPQSIDFGQLKVNQAARATVTVICPADGEVSVRYRDAFSKARVVQVSVFDGDWSSNDLQKATPAPVNTTTTGSIAVLAGQELRVELEFVCPQTGRIDGKLDITGSDWKASVPTTASVSLLGPLVGALALPVERALGGITGTTLVVPVKLLSLSPGAVTARLTPEELPAGVSAEPFAVAVGPGQTLSGDLRLHISESTPEGIELPLRFSLDTGGAAKGRVSLSLNVYQPWLEFPFVSRNPSGNILLYGKVQIKSDGTWILEASVTDWNEDNKAGLAQFWFPSQGGPTTGFSESIPLDAGKTVRFVRTGSSAWLKSHYTEAARTGVKVEVYGL